MDADDDHPYGPTVLAVPLGRGDYPPEQRADLARWVVALRRAHAAGTAQTCGNLHDEQGYCCLGLWCEVAEVRGLLDRRDDLAFTEWRSANGRVWQSGSLPGAAHLGGWADPDLFQYASRADVENPFTVVTATVANDEHGDNFDRIADLVVWSYALTDAELAAAEREPWVPEIEGPQP